MGTPRQVADKLVRYRDMVRVGFVLNVAMAALVTAALSVLC